MIILDASSTIISANAAALGTILSLPGTDWCIGEIVVGECRGGGHTVPELDDAIRDGLIRVLDDSEIDAELYTDLLGVHNLGEGETECLAYASISGCDVWTDDRRATTILKKEIGEKRVHGFAPLLKRCIQNSLLSADDAYRLAQAKGAYLPDVSSEYFGASNLL